MFSFGFSPSREVLQMLLNSLIAWKEEDNVFFLFPFNDSSSSTLLCDDWGCRRRLRLAGTRLLTRPSL